MFFNCWVENNLFVLDSIDFVNLKIPKGNSCFIIGHHIRDERKINENSNLLIEKGYRNFFIFGEQSPLWSKAFETYRENYSLIKIESTKVDNFKFSYNLAYMLDQFPELVNLVISDDYYFTEYLMEDIDDIFNGRSLFSVDDWKLFKKGFEFKYNNKDCIIYVGDDIILGILGKEKYYNNTFKAFREKIFDRYTFIDIWNDIKSI